MGIYLVDYENVHNDGVTDIQKLSASDRVVIFYGDSIKSIPFETHVEMMASKAAIEYIETHKVAKNYLDFQLATYLGFLIGKGEKGPVYIISQDTGFDSIVDFWRGRNIEAFRQPSIASPSTPKDVSLKKGTSTKKKKKKSDHVPKESKKETKEVKETKEIVEKKKPEKKKLPEAIRKKNERKTPLIETSILQDGGISLIAISCSQTVFCITVYSYYFQRNSAFAFRLI